MIEDFDIQDSVKLFSCYELQLIQDIRLPQIPDSNIKTTNFSNFPRAKRRISNIDSPARKRCMGK